ncbi:MAG TPA: hypothetical protein VIL74_20285 [Pyrinomonadaceae bacterium]|jgi:hypothetical protein
MRKILFLTCFFSFVFAVSAQDDFQWKNLRFETSTVGDAVAALGKPDKDKIEKVKFDKAVPAPTRAQMNFRKLHYRDVGNYSEVYLLFLNDKLHSIGFTPQKKSLPAGELGKSYGAEFLFMEAVPKRMNLADFEGQKETTVPKVYPAEYFMLGIKKDYALLATIDNDSWKAVWRDTLNKPTAEMFPGYVRTIQVFSRNYEGK